MTFKRTPQGLSNLRRFLNAKAVVFVEGGQHSYSYSDVQAASFGTDGIDVFFWAGLFSVFVPGERFAFRSVGTKDTLRQIAEDIASGRVTGVIVCTDRDHDIHYKTILLHPAIIYTRGYSWENDACDCHVIVRVISILTGSIETSEIARSVYEFSLKVSRELRWVIRADILGVLIGRSVVPRDAPDSIISVEAGAVRINCHRVRTIIRSIQAERNKFTLAFRMVRIKPDSDAVGKLFMRLWYRFSMSYLAEKGFRGRIAYDYFSSLCASTLHALLQHELPQPSFEYYKDKIRGAMVAM